MIWVLVDYANLPRLDKERGIPFVMNSLLNRLGNDLLRTGDLVRVRLYSGWYDGLTLSKQAQQVSAQVADYSPAPLLIRGPLEPVHVRVQVELARSLLSAPSQDILHTYRVRAFPTGLSCKTFPFDRCADERDCPISAVSEFIVRRKCPNTSCDIRPKQLISRQEQKIVDTMLTADLIDLALRERRIVLVSSDDDMWPGIRLSISNGATVIHMQTKKGQRLDPYYRSSLHSGYIEIGAP